jgi:tetratricopeptide (TPR) repeat protein
MRLIRSRLLPAFCLASLLPACLLPGDLFALTAGDARTRSFKLQSEGMRLYREGKYNEAIEAFRQVVNLHLNSFMAWYYLGASLLVERRYSEAIEPLKIALDLQPDYVQAHLALGDAYLKNGETDEARASYLRALDLQPGYAPGHDGLGRMYESLGKVDDAEAEYRKALEINIAFADAYTHLGELLMRRGRLAEATRLFLKAIAMKPDFSQAYSRLGVALARQNRFDDAIAAARKSQALAPRDPEPLVALARIYVDLQSFGRAHDALDAAFKIDPEHIYAHLALADLRRAEGNLSAAEEGLRTRYEKGVDDPRMKRAAYDALVKLRADIERLAALRAAVAANPANAEAKSDLARFLGEQKGHLMAAELLDEAVRGEAHDLPTDVALAYEAAVEYLAARRQARAIDLFAAIAATDTASPEMRAAARFNLGVARAAAGLDAEAAQTFRDYLVLRPGDPQALLYLGNSLLRTGQSEQARNAYTAYLQVAETGPESEEVRRLLQGLGTAPAGGAP